MQSNQFNFINIKIIFPISLFFIHKLKIERIMSQKNIYFFSSQAIYLPILYKEQYHFILLFNSFFYFNF